MRGMWVTYFELGALFDAPEGFRAAWDALLDKVEQVGVNALFVHVRSHCDAYYPSELFPWSKYCTGSKGTPGADPGFDPLDYMLAAAHRRGMAFHAWINPYRVLYDSDDLAMLADDSPAKRWLTDEDGGNDSWVQAAAGGLYLNPAAGPVQALVVDGVRELVSRYDVDGVHFDDYFYPVSDESFDEREYVSYRTAVWDDPLPLADWRRAHVTAMLARVCDTVHTVRGGCVFGVSPMASVEGNYSRAYADVAAWLDAGAVDYLMPQLYFGFEYPDETCRFDALLTRWKAVVGERSVPLYAGLGAYRINSTDSGHEEWRARHDLLARQICCGRQEGCAGYCLYSFGALFTDDEPHAAERAALRRLLDH